MFAVGISTMGAGQAAHSDRQDWSSCPRGKGRRRSSTTSVTLCVRAVRSPAGWPNPTKNPTWRAMQ